MIEAAIDFVNTLIAKAPPAFWPLFLGWGISVGLTQRVKFYLPLTWSVRLRALLTQGTAFWSALLIVWGLWPDRYGFLSGVFVGIWSPAFYAIFVRVAVPTSIRDYLSADVRE